MSKFNVSVYGSGSAFVEAKKGLHTIQVGDKKISKFKIKKVSYSCVNGYLPLNIVAYAKYGDQIIFIGLHSVREGLVGSTINNAENIVSEIAKAENIDPRKYLFCDLQTHLQYTDHKPGDYTLKLKWAEGTKPISVDWFDCHATDELLTNFSEFIWGNSTPGIARNMAIYYTRLASKRT